MNTGGLVVNRIMDSHTGVEIRVGQPVDGNPYYFDMVELEAAIKAMPGGNGRWIALNAIIAAENKRGGGQASAHVVQKWMNQVL